MTNLNERDIDLMKNYAARGLFSEYLVKNIFALLDKYQLSKVPSKDKAFFRELEGIDFMKVIDGELQLFEVKAKNHDSKNKFDICSWSMDSYLKAQKKGYKVNLIIVTYYPDWKLNIRVVPFRKGLFKVNNGGYYKR